jgi:histidyl-tRNA synthetase
VLVPLCHLQVRKELRACHFHVDADVTDRKMQKKVREAQLAQYNYILVVGEQEKVSMLRLVLLLLMFANRDGGWCHCVVALQACSSLFAAHGAVRTAAVANIVRFTLSPVRYSSR